MLRYILTILGAVSIFFNGFGQPQGSNDTIYLHPFDLSDTLFDQLSQSNIPSGKLYDRVLEPSEVVPRLDGITSTDTVDALLWLTAYTEMYWAARRPASMQDTETLLNLLNADHAQSIRQGTVRIPIGIIDYDYQYVDPQALATGLIYGDALQFKDYGPNSASAYHTSTVFVAAPLTHTASSPDVELYLSEDYIMTDKRNEMVAFEVNYDGQWVSITPGQAISMRAYSGDIVIGIRVTYADQTVKSNISVIPDQEIVTMTSRAEEIAFDFEGEIPGPSGVDLEYGVVYGCNTGQGPRKPVILVPGYQPDFAVLPGVSGVKSLDWLWDQMNFDGFLDKLVANGYDVYITRLLPPNGSLESSGEVLIDFLEEINIQKAANGSAHENIIIALSAGGQAARYALTKMEYEHLNNNGDPHHTRLFVPFDSPHHGATIPLGSQLAARSEMTIPGSALSFVIGLQVWWEIQSGAARDMLLYHGDNYSMSPLTIQNLAPSPVSDRNNYLSTVNGFNSGSVHPGFPDDTRNIAVSLGGYNDSPAGFDAGDLLFFKHGPKPSWWAITYKTSSIRAAENGPSEQVFFRLNIVDPLIPFAPTVVTVLHRYSGNGMREIDNCNASYVNLIHLAATLSLVADGIGIPPLVYDLSDKPFMPVVASTGIYESNTVLPWGTDMSIDLQASGLLTDQVGGTNVTTSNIGYPRLNYPTNHFDITPFESLYCDFFSNQHIRVEFNGDDISDYMLEEITPFDMWFQNEQVGEYAVTTPGFKYVADYEAKTSIRAGENVTYKTDIAPYRVLANADVEHKAGNFVTLEPGFEATSGSVYVAYIGPMDCCEDWKSMQQTTEVTKVKGGNIIHYTDLEDRDREVFPYLQGESRDLKFQVYPNPSRGKFKVYVLGELDENAEVLITDVSGRILEQNTVSSTYFTVDLTNQNSGVYILRLKINGETIVQKLIKE